MPSPEWVVPSAPPSLPPQHCHVWWAEPAQARDAHLRLLDAGERGRRDRLVRAADRARFTVGCALLRLVIAELTGIAPDAVELDRSCPDCDRPHGKPKPRQAADLECSVSHSGDRVAVAVTYGARIGVDVEQVDPDVDDRLADRVLTAVEIAALAHMQPARRAWGFSTYWTRKEAVLKAAGFGLRVAPDQVTVSAPADQPRLLEAGDPALAGSALTLYALHAGEGYAAALAAVDGELVSVPEFDAGPLLEDTSAPVA